MLAVVWDDSDPADWVGRAAADGLVGEAVSEGFEAYARVLHPAGFEDRVGSRPVTWGTVATLHGHEVHADSRWDDIAGSTVIVKVPSASTWNREPVEGSLSSETAAVLGRVLASHTGTPDVVWLCAWEGWAGLKWAKTGSEVGPLATGRRGRRVWWGASHQPERNPLPTVPLLGREYVLLRGSIEDVDQSVVERPAWQAANLWWPEDRSWFLSTPIDARSTYIGGSQACIDELLQTDGIETLPVSATR